MRRFILVRRYRETEDKKALIVTVISESILYCLARRLINFI